MERCLPCKICGLLGVSMEYDGLVGCEGEKEEKYFWRLHLLLC